MVNPFITPEGNTSTVDREGSQQEQTLLETALTYAQDGIPVFPCVPGGKNPLTNNGFYDATTNEAQIREWWNRWPDANIGIPTGQASGILALDVDTGSGPSSLENLTREHGELPETARVKTGRGGVHYLFRYPVGQEIRNSAGKLGLGLDVRATGGYIVAPPSRTEAVYEWLDRRPLANPSEWLLEAARRPDRASGEGDGAPAPIPEGGPIPEGHRNVTLIRIAGRLRAQGHEQGAILATLEQVNADRCVSPLPASEVEKIARSACRYPAGNAPPKVTPETLELCRRIEECVLWGRRWPGLGGKSQRALVLTVLLHAVLCGELIPGGIRVSLSQRAASEDSTISRKAIRNALKNLKPAGIMRIDPSRKPGESGAFVLVLPSAQGVTTQTTIRESVNGGYPLRASYSAPRLRHSAPGVVRRLGKGCEEFADALELAGGRTTVQELAAMIHHPRARDLRRREGKRLEAAGVVEWDGDTVSFTEAWRESWHCARVEGGEIESARLQRQRHEREREAYRHRHESHPERAPSRSEMDARRRERESVDGTISELGRVEAPQLTPSELADLEAIRRYECSHGTGSFLWDQTSAKRLFYSREGRGHWPDPGELERIRAYVDAAASLEAVA